MAWLGGTKLADKTWIWTDGQEWTYDNWRLEQNTFDTNTFVRRKNSLVLWTPSGKAWNGTKFSKKYSYVCQYLDMNQFIQQTDTTTTPCTPTTTSATSTTTTTTQTTTTTTQATTTITTTSTATTTTATTTPTTTTTPPTTTTFY